LEVKYVSHLRSRRNARTGRDVLAPALNKSKDSLGLKTVKKNGKEMLVSYPKDKWALLRLLDDDYLDAVLTGQKYEVTGKRPYQP
jgi:hypothetical protein